jgi:hypothetical protein
MKLLKNKPTGYAQVGDEMIGFLFEHPTSNDALKMAAGWMLPDMDALKSDYFSIHSEALKSLDAIAARYEQAKGENGENWAKRAAGDVDALIRSARAILDAADKSLKPDKVQIPLRDASIEILPLYFDKYVIRPISEMKIADPLDPSSEIVFDAGILSRLTPEQKQAAERIEGRSLTKWTDFISPGIKADAVKWAFSDIRYEVIGDGDARMIFDRNMRAFDYFLGRFGTSSNLLLAELLIQMGATTPMKVLRLIPQADAALWSHLEQERQAAASNGRPFLTKDALTSFIAKQGD